MSILPASSESACAVVASSMNSKFISGSSRLNSPMTSGRKEYMAEATKPMRTSLGPPKRIVPIRSLTTAIRPRRRAASFSRYCPAGVILTPLGPRSNRATPSSSSSSMICLLRGGWDMWSLSAARPKLSSSATARKDVKCLRSIEGSSTGYGYLPK